MSCFKVIKYIFLRSTCVTEYLLSLLQFISLYFSYIDVLKSDLLKWYYCHHCQEERVRWWIWCDDEWASSKLHKILVAYTKKTTPLLLTCSLVIVAIYVYHIDGHHHRTGEIVFSSCVAAWVMGFMNGRVSYDTFWLSVVRSLIHY